MEASEGPEDTAGGKTLRCEGANVFGGSGVQAWKTPMVLGPRLEAYTKLPLGCTAISAACRGEDAREGVTVRGPQG